MKTRDAEGKTVVARRLRKLQQLDSAVTLDFFRSPPGNHLEALAGKRQCQYSIRINQQFRTCFRWTPKGPEDVEIVDYHQWGKSSMITNGMRPVHPGEILQADYLLPLKLTTAALSEALHVPPAHINNIVDEKHGITAGIALRLAHNLGGDAQSWLNLQQAYDLKVAQRDSLPEIVANIVPRNAAGTLAQ